MMFTGIWTSLKRSHQNQDYEDEDEERRLSNSKSTFTKTKTKRRLLAVDTNSLAKTPFPEFDLDELGTVPDAYLSDTSSLGENDTEENTEGQRTEHSKGLRKHRCKEDQDVAVFVELAKSMSLRSLLHLLQGQARAQQNLPPQYLQQYASLATKQEEAKSKSCQPKKLPVKHKKFRFAELNGNKVRVVVHEVDSLLSEDANTKSKLWWSAAEMQKMRENAIQLVKYYCTHRPDYIRSIEVVARGNGGQGDDVETHMKRLLDPANAQARGLEAHIVHTVFSYQLRREMIQAVLQEQAECRASMDGYEMTSHCLRGQSVAHSALYSSFAAKMGSCDHVDALRATVSCWRPRRGGGSHPPPAAGATSCGKVFWLPGHSSTNVEESATIS